MTDLYQIKPDKAERKDAQKFLKTQKKLFHRNWDPNVVIFDSKGNLSTEDSAQEKQSSWGLFWKATSKLIK